jgi:hypothetical protein
LASSTCRRKRACELLAVFFVVVDFFIRFLWLR